MSKGKRRRKRRRRKKEGGEACQACGSPIPELAAFCPSCGQLAASAPREELLSKPLPEPPIGEVPEMEAMPEEETALPPPLAAVPEATGMAQSLAAEGEPGEGAQVPEPSAVTEAPVSLERVEKREAEEESPLTQLVKQYDRRFDRIIELGRMLRGFELASDTYVKLSGDVLRSIQALRAEMRSRLDEGGRELTEMETNKVELQISMGELERRRETEGLPSDLYEEQIVALRSTLEEIEGEIRLTKRGLKDLEDWREIDGKYEALCARYPDLFDLERRIDAVQEKAGDRRKAVEALFSEEKVEPQPPVEAEAAPEVSVIREVPGEEAPPPPSPEPRAPEQRPVQRRPRELLLDVPEGGSQLLPLWLRRGDSLAVHFKPLKRHLVSPISAMLFTREDYSKLLSGKPVSRKILENYAKESSDKGRMSYDSQVEDFHYLLFLSSSSKPERVRVVYEIGAEGR